MPAVIVSDNTATYADGTTVQTTVFDDGTSTVRTIPGPGTPEAIRQQIVVKLGTAIDANAADRATDATIMTWATSLAATTGDRTVTQLSDDVRAITDAVGKLAQADRQGKRELTALVRLAVNKLTTLSGT